MYENTYLGTRNDVHYILRSKVLRRRSVPIVVLRFKRQRIYIPVVPCEVSIPALAMTGHFRIELSLYPSILKNDS